MQWKEGKGTPDELSGFVGMQIRKPEEGQTEITVSGVLPDSPAVKAGLKKDDVLLRVAGEAATDLQSTVARVRRVKPGSDLALRVRRDGKEMDLSVKVGVVPFFFLD